jgi:hypothetical protein
MKKKLFRVVVGVGAIIFCTYCILDFIDMTRQKSTQDLKRNLVAVTSGLEETPAGMPRAVEFIRRIKAVDASHAPAEVQQALQNYIAALEDALDAMKAGRDSSPYNKPMAEAKEHLRQALAKLE